MSGGSNEETTGTNFKESVVAEPNLVSLFSRLVRNGRRFSSNRLEFISSEARKKRKTFCLFGIPLFSSVSPPETFRPFFKKKDTRS